MSTDKPLDLNECIDAMDKLIDKTSEELFCHLHARLLLEQKKKCPDDEEMSNCLMMKITLEAETAKSARGFKGATAWLLQLVINIDKDKENVFDK